VQKIVDETQQYIKEYKIQYALALEPAIHELIEYFPEWIMYFRCGTVPTNANTLVNLEGHIHYFQNLDIPVIYYIDDAIFWENAGAPLKLMVNCDAIIVATDALKEFISGTGEFNLNFKQRPIHIIKTHMDLPTFDMILLDQFSYLMDRSKYNILFTSQGRIGATMLYKIIKLMNETPEKYRDVVFTIVSHQVANIRAAINGFRGIKKVYYEFMPLIEFYALCGMSNLILAPGDKEDLRYFLDEERQGLWLDSKSCVKYTLAGAAKIPIIASPIREYKQAITPGVTGFIATTPEEWVSYIDKLHEDSDLSAKIGRAARKDVNDNWHIYNRTKEFAKIYNELKR